MTRYITLGELVEFSTDEHNMLTIRKTKLAEELEKKFPYFHVCIEQGYDVVSVFITDTDKTVQMIASRNFYGEVLIIDFYLHTGTEKYLLLALETAKQLVVATIDTEEGDETLSVGLTEQDIRRVAYCVIYP